MKKVVISVVLTISMLFSLAQLAFAEDNIKVIIDGESITFDQPPMQLLGSTFVPMRAIFERYGAQIVWVNETKTASVYKGDIVIAMQIDNTIATKQNFKVENSEYVFYNYQEIKLAAPPLLINGTTMVPLRFVSEAFGATVTWDAKTKTVNITTGDAGKETTITSPSTGQQLNQNLDPNKPYDMHGKEIHVGDVVNCGVFYGTVNEIKGSKILVYWNSKSMFIKDEDVSFWAMTAGVNYESEQWMESKDVEIDSSAY